MCKMKKIVFIEPKSELPTYLGDLSWTKATPMLGPLILGTILQEKGYDVKVYKEALREPDYENLDCEYLCLYSMTSTHNRLLKIAQKYKHNNPSGKVIAGGPHVTFLPEKTLKIKYNGKYLVDYVVMGEAEEVIVDVVENKYNGRLIDGNKVKNLDSQPTINFSLLQGLKNKIDWFPVATSRGCPYGCSFCSVAKMFGRNQRYRSADLVINDILEAESKYDFNKLFFYDDNLFSSHKKGKNLLHKIADRGIKKSLFIQSRINIFSDNELLNLLGKISGNDTTLFFGLESLNDKTLKVYNKKQSLKNIRSSVKKVKDYGFKIMGAFIFGSDEDDKDTIKRTCDFCDEVEIDYPQFTILTPLPGTDLYHELEKQKRIITKNWNFFDVAHVVHKPLKMKTYELQEEFINAYKRVYGYTNKRFLKQFIGQINKDISWIFSFKWFNLRSIIKNVASENLTYIEYLKTIEKEKLING